MTTTPLSLPIISACIFLLFASVMKLGAQEEPGRDSPPAHPFVGLVVGANGLPDVFFYGCSTYSDNFGGTEESLLAGVLFGLPLGSFHLETRTLNRRESGSYACITYEPIFESGIHTERSPLAETGTQTTSDLRIGYGIPLRLPLVASAGAGWIWGNDIPYLTSGLSLRTAGKIRLTVDLFWETYRVPFLLTAEEWEDFRLVRVVGEKEKHDWQHGWSLQLGIAGYIRE